MLPLVFFCLAYLKLFGITGYGTGYVDAFKDDDA